MYLQGQIQIELKPFCVCLQPVRAALLSLEEAEMQKNNSVLKRLQPTTTELEINEHHMLLIC